MKEDNVKSVIRQAAEKRHTLLMVYLKSSDGLIEREVEPYEIREDDLFAFDVKKNGIRRFKINLISQIAESNHKFIPKWELKMN